VSNQCDPVEQNAVQDLLETWYEMDGRHERSHPMHGLYCGLAEIYRQQEVGDDD
jgi:hypothetical protein